MKANGYIDTVLGGLVMFLMAIFHPARFRRVIHSGYTVIEAEDAQMERDARIRRLKNQA